MKLRTRKFLAGLLSFGLLLQAASPLSALAAGTTTEAAHKLTLTVGSTEYTLTSDGTNVTTPENWPSSYPAVSYDDGFVFNGGFSSAVDITGTENVTIKGGNYAVNGALNASVNDLTVTKNSSYGDTIAAIRGAATIDCTGDVNISGNLNYGSVSLVNQAVYGKLTVNSAQNVSIDGILNGGADINCQTLSLNCGNGSTVRGTLTVHNAQKIQATAYAIYGVIGDSGAKGQLVLDGCTGAVTLLNTYSASSPAIRAGTVTVQSVPNGYESRYYAGSSEATSTLTTNANDCASNPYFRIEFVDPTNNRTLTLKNAKAYKDADCKTELINATSAEGTSTYHVAKDTTVYVKAIAPDEEYHFTGWTGSDSKDEVLTLKVTDDTTLTANWAEMYQIYIGGNIYKDTSGAEYFAPDTTVALRATAPERDTTDIGYVFDKWAKDEGSADFTYGTIGGQPCNDKQELTYIVMPAGDVRLKTSWIKYYSITTDNCKLEGNKLSYPAGTKITITADETTTDAAGKTLKLSEIVVAPKDGYEGKTFKADGSNGTYTFTMPAYPAVVTAKYETVKAKYTLTLKDAKAYEGNDELQGTTGEDGTTTYEVEDGKELKIKAVAPGEDYNFAGWEESEETSEEIKITVTGSMTLTAKWVKQTAHTLTLTNAKAYTDETYTTLLEPTTEGGNEYSVEEGTMVYLKTEKPEEEARWECYWYSETNLLNFGLDTDDLHSETISFKMPDDNMELEVRWYKLYYITANGEPYVFMDGTSDVSNGWMLALSCEKVAGYDQDTGYSEILWEKDAGSADFEFIDDTNENSWFPHVCIKEEGDVKLKVTFTESGYYKVNLDDNCELVNEDEAHTQYYQTGETVTVKVTEPADENQKLDKITVTLKKDGSTITPKKGADGNYTFTMPSSPVTVTANWKDSDGDDVIPDDTTVTTDPGSTAGGAVAAVMVGGAAVLGGYEITTRVILHNLLPEGASIPANRGQLAWLIWGTKGAPLPENQPAFTDVSDPEIAMAAQWCVEQGIMDTKTEDTFNPEGWTPKFKVIETWNKAFPVK